ncbi:MAG: pyridoxal 5'-phosphate synthase glutaminase subunit PdxT [Thermoplasmata archaeon]|nr:MAG: pyridoxal 5'-phosphate synthase glutaminase subunit PdxT [Thermoplasmata archaeon]
MKVGIIAFQGAIEEHRIALEKTMEKMGEKGKVFLIKEKMEDIDALVIPGGESTTISNLMRKTGIFDEIIAMAEEIPIMGTCAGCILLAKEIKNGVETLKIMDMEVERNAFGRQKESFQCSLPIEGFDKPFPAVFIRAPLIKKVWGDCIPLARIGEGIVMAKQGNKIALAFHPELTDDLRVHQYFLEMI